MDWISSFMGKSLSKMIITRLIMGLTKGTSENGESSNLNLSVLSRGNIE